MFNNHNRLYINNLKFKLLQKDHLKVKDLFQQQFSNNLLNWENLDLNISQKKKFGQNMKQSNHKNQSQKKLNLLIIMLLNILLNIILKCFKILMLTIILLKEKYKESNISNKLKKLFIQWYNLKLLKQYYQQFKEHKLQLNLNPRLLKQDKPKKISHLNLIRQLFNPKLFNKSFNNQLFNKLFSLLLFSHNQLFLILHRLELFNNNQSILVQIALLLAQEL